MYKIFKYTDMLNVHMHRNPKTLTTLLVQVRNFYYLLLGFRHEERETQFLRCWLFVQCQVSTHRHNQRACTPKQTTRLVSVQISTRFVQLQISTNCFFQNTHESQPIASWHDVIHISSPISYPGYLLRHLWLSPPPRTSVNTCAQCVPLPVH